MCPPTLARMLVLSKSQSAPKAAPSTAPSVDPSAQTTAPLPAPVPVPEGRKTIQPVRTRPTTLLGDQPLLAQNQLDTQRRKRSTLLAGEQNKPTLKPMSGGY